MSSESTSLPDPIFIARPAALERLAKLLRQEPMVAVDTESNSLYAYQEQVCLVQFSTPDYDYLVDPLALLDFSCLAPIFSDPHIQKVFHAAEYDIICLRRDFGFEFANIFDTMVAARILGREEVGLGSILETEFGIKLDKRFQRANWGRRPIPPDLMAYARLDTHYLIPLRERMLQELQDKGFWPLAREDFQRLTLANGRSNGERSEECWRINGARDLSPQQAAVLKELCRYRHQVARFANRPLFKIMGDRTLLAIAERCPTRLHELEGLPGMTEGQIERHGEELLAAVQRGFQAKPVHPPRNPRPEEKFLDRLEALRTWRKDTAQKMGVPSDVVLPRDLMVALAEMNPGHSGELAEVMDSVPWRLERFGEQILELLGGNPPGPS
jgi:ribonuclease D